MKALIPAQTRRVVTVLRSVNPLAAALAARLARLTGSDLAGQRGSILAGEKFSRKNSGYLATPQSFRGLPTRGAAPAGAIRAGMDSGLPGTQAPFSETSPLLAAIARAQNPAAGAKK